MTCNVITTYMEVQPLRELKEGEIYKEESSSGKVNFQRETQGLSLLRNRWYSCMISLGELGDFNRAVAKLPSRISLTKACSDYDIDHLMFS